MVNSTPTPTQPDERIASLDILRGFAVLGILVMNIQNFSMISAAYLNPMAYGDLTGINKLVWMLSHLFADLKFMGLFSILFGAGLILFTERLETKGRKPGGVYFRRMFWLLIIGAIHGYLFWSGDILFSYAVCGFLLFFFRKMKARSLMILGVLVLGAGSLLYLLSGLSLPFWPEQSVQQTLLSWKPEPSFYEREIALLTGSFAEQLQFRIPETIKFQTFLFFFFIGWRAGGMMLIGMALYKWRILTAERSPAFYTRLMAGGFLLGLAVIGTGIQQNFAANWSLEFSMFLGMQYNYWGSLAMVAGYIGLLMLFSKSGTRSGLKNALAATGRMAFTNYLMQTVICTWIFYGHGLGLFGRVERWGQILIVFAIWGIQLVLSPLWLRYFRYGPVEWLWRSLTYVKLQSMVYGRK